MRLGPVLAVVVAVAGLTAMVTAFLTQASPYVTVAQAKTMKGDSLHLAGDILRDTVQVDARANRLRFELKDEAGQVMPVLYHGPQPSNMGSATKVVAVGGVENGVFVARELLLKCPSKYESTDK